MKKLLLSTLFLLGSTFVFINSTSAVDLNEMATVLKDSGVTKLTPSNTNYTQNLKRREAALLLKRVGKNIFAIKENTSAKCYFSDISKLEKSIQTETLESCKIGLFKGSNGKFNPNANITYGEIAIVLARLIMKDPSYELEQSFDMLINSKIATQSDRNNSKKPINRAGIYGMLYNSLHTDESGDVANNEEFSKVFQIHSYSIQDYEKHYIPEVQGSAVLIDNRHVITNAHVVLNDNNEPYGNYEICRSIDFTKTPECFSVAKLIYYDRNNDLALLEIENTANLPTPVEFSDITPTLGKKITVYGYPVNGGLTVTRTQGSIAGFEDGVYKIDAQIDEGNSGGGSFDENGKLIGIPTFMYVNQTVLGYMVPVSTIKNFLNKQNVTTYDEAPDADFAAERKQVWSELSKEGIDNGVFSLGGFGSFTLKSVNLNTENNLYMYVFLSADKKVSLSIRTVKIIGNYDENILIDLIKKQNASTESTTLQDKILGGNTRSVLDQSEIKSNKDQKVSLYIQKGGKLQTQVRALLMGDKNSTLSRQEAEKVLGQISIKPGKNGQITDSINVGPVSFMNNKDIFFTQSLGTEIEVATIISPSYTSGTGTSVGYIKVKKYSYTPGMTVSSNLLETKESLEDYSFTGVEAKILENANGEKLGFIKGREDDEDGKLNFTITIFQKTNDEKVYGYTEINYTVGSTNEEEGYQTVLNIINSISLPGQDAIDFGNLPVEKATSESIKVPK